MKGRNFFTWFTLVELIVVITILVILGTIAFVSFHSFSIAARDSARLNDVKIIEKGLNIYSAKWNIFPFPDNKINITASWALITYQWEVWTWVLLGIEQAWSIVDPFFNIPYTYSTSKWRDEFQILSHFEKEVTSSNLSIPINKTYALSYGETLPRVFWNELWIFTLSDNTPISSWSSLELDNINDDEYIYHINNSLNLQKKQDILFYGWIKYKEMSLLDDSLIWYWDFETLASPSEIDDFSKSKTLGKCYKGWIESNCNITSDGTMRFNGIDEYIELENYIPHYWNEEISIIIKWFFNDDSNTGNFDALIWNYCWNPWVSWFAIKLNGNVVESRDYTTWTILQASFIKWEMANYIVKRSALDSRTYFYVNNELRNLSSINSVWTISLCPMRF